MAGGEPHRGCRPAPRRRSARVPTAVSCLEAFLSHVALFGAEVPRLAIRSETVGVGRTGANCPTRLARESRPAERRQHTRLGCTCASPEKRTERPDSGMAALSQTCTRFLSAGREMVAGTPVDGDGARRDFRNGTMAGRPLPPPVLGARSCRYTL